jgi:hypothetical protein
MQTKTATRVVPTENSAEDGNSYNSINEIFYARLALGEGAVFLVQLYLYIGTFLATILYGGLVL